MIEKNWKLKLNTIEMFLLYTGIHHLFNTEKDITSYLVIQIPVYVYEEIL